MKIQSAQQLRDMFDDLLTVNEEKAHAWLRAKFQELHDTAVSREDDEATVRAAEILCDLAGLSEAEHTFTIESNGILSPSPKTVQARAAALCKRLAECRELTAAEEI
jgi:hypothetical protein